MAEALAKIKNNLIHPATTGDTDGSLLTNLLEALTAGARLNVGAYGRSTYSPSNYSTAGQIVDDHLAGIDTALGGKASTSHKDTHKAEASDAFTSSDLLDAVVKRLQVTGPVTLTVGACADGEFLKRSGTAIVGSNVDGDAGQTAVSGGPFTDGDEHTIATVVLGTPASGKNVIISASGSVSLGDSGAAAVARIHVDISVDGGSTWDDGGSTTIQTNSSLGRQLGARHHVLSSAATGAVHARMRVARESGTSLSVNNGNLIATYIQAT